MLPQLLAFFIHLVFLGHAFTMMIVYVWSRRNPYIRMNFFGILNFQAPYLPWVLFGFSLLLGNSLVIDLMGECVCKHVPIAVPICKERQPVLEAYLRLGVH